MQNKLTCPQHVAVMYHETCLDPDMACQLYLVVLCHIIVVKILLAAVDTIRLDGVILSLKHTVQYYIDRKNAGLRLFP